MSVLYSEPDDKPTRVAHNVLHAAVFGSHLDTCPRCKRQHRCSDPYDCQLNRYCLTCELETEPEDEL